MLGHPLPSNDVNLKWSKLAGSRIQPGSCLKLSRGGTVENSQYLYDAKRGILYTYREDDFACPNGNPESGSILMALYARGNPASKPVGSGWYLVNLNAGQCAAKKAGTFGCKFDANANATECGAATINDATGEVDVVLAK